jgi:hypothetical protein
MKRLIATLAATGLLVAAGCAGQGAVGVEPVDTNSGSPTPSERPSTGPSTEPTTGPTPSGSPTTTTSEPTPSGTVTYEVWFTLNDRLSPVTRTDPATQAVGSASMNALLAGPDNGEAQAGKGTQIPPGTKLLGLNISGGTATVDLSGEFLSGGSAVSEFTRIGQVVFTISQFKTVDDVNLRLDGDPVKTFDQQGRSLGRAWTREDFELLLPAIIVESPAVGQTVTSPVTVSGTADVFEATVSMRIQDRDGNVLAEAFTTATCGSGCRGDFSQAVGFHVTQTQPGTVMVFESSAEDGRPINVVRIPVILQA